MRFLVDAQLPPALARWLTERGHQAQHVADIGMMAATDHQIWQWAIEHQAVILTKDEDFAVLKSRPSAKQASVVWIRVGNTRRAELLGLMESLLPRIITSLQDGETIVEIR